MDLVLEMDLDIRKGIHVKLLSETHTGLKLQACRLKLSMQAILDEMASLVAMGDPYVIGVLEDLARRKRDRQARELSVADAESLLDHLEDMRRREGT